LVLKHFWGTEIYKPNPITLLLWIAAIISGATAVRIRSTIGIETASDLSLSF
jgi:hypothetical protein